MQGDGGGRRGGGSGGAMDRVLRRSYIQHVTLSSGYRTRHLPGAHVGNIFMVRNSVSGSREEDRDSRWSAMHVM